MVTCVTIRNLCVTKGCLERSWLCGSFIDCEWSSDTKVNWIELFEVIPTCSDFLAGLGSLWVSLYDWSSLLCRTGWVFTPHLFKLRSSLRWYSLLNICTKYTIALEISPILFAGTSIPKSGADYAYIGEAFGSLPSFLYLWDAIFIFVPTTNAIMGLTVANYLAQPLFPDCDPPDEALRLIAAVSNIVPQKCFLGLISSLGRSASLAWPGWTATARGSQPSCRTSSWWFSCTCLHLLAHLNLLIC